MNVRLERNATGKAKNQSPVARVTQNFILSSFSYRWPNLGVAKIAVFVKSKTIGSSVDGFFAGNSSENIVLGLANCGWSVHRESDSKSLLSFTQMSSLCLWEEYFR